MRIVFGLLHRYPAIKTIMQASGKRILVMELGDGLRKHCKVESNPLCAAGIGRLSEQEVYGIGINMDGLASVALRRRGTLS